MLTPLRRMGQVLLPCLLCGMAATAVAQRNHADMSESEVEQVREVAPEPAQRVAVFQRIIDTRFERMQRVLTDVRAQGRAADIHHNMEDVASLVNELEDNLDEYADAHRDLRKPLPGLIAATERWQSLLRQPPEQSTYKVARELALEAVTDLKSQATKLIPEQQAYFKEHPPAKDPGPQQYKVEQGSARHRDREE